jgi:PTS system cellobiose-specific IIB component
MKNIVLICAAGMSTGLLVNKMIKIANEEKLDIIIQAYPIAEAPQIVPSADIVLVGPQIRYEMPKLRANYPDKIIELIDMRVYGTLDAKSLLSFIEERLGSL